MSEKQYSVKELTEVASRYYSTQGFQSRVGYGKRPALINVDLANAWTRPGNPFSCDNMDEVVENVRLLLAAGRAKRIPVAFTTTAYEPGHHDAGLWIKKIPSFKILRVGSELCAIDERIKPREGEHVIVKKMASAFNGTKLAGLLNVLQVDTAIITGVTACACVRHTVEDAISHGFRPIVPRETVSDRVPGVLEWNLFDIDAKFGDVEPIERVLEYLKNIEPFSYPVQVQYDD